MMWFDTPGLQPNPQPRLRQCDLQASVKVCLRFSKIPTEGNFYATLVNFPFFFPSRMKWNNKKCLIKSINQCNVKQDLCLWGSIRVHAFVCFVCLTLDRKTGWQQVSEKAAALMQLLIGFIEYASPHAVVCHLISLQFSITCSTRVSVCAHAAVGDVQVLFVKFSLQYTKTVDKQEIIDQSVHSLFSQYLLKMWLQNKW